MFEYGGLLSTASTHEPPDGAAAAPGGLPRAAPAAADGPVAMSVYTSFLLAASRIRTLMM